MWIIIINLLIGVNAILASWENEKLCPITCACRLQHISETAIYRFMQQDKEDDKHHSEAHVHVNNDVLYDEDFDTTFEEENSMLRTVTCILQTETDIQKLLESLPKDIDSLTLIQGSDSGNKTMKFSYLLEYPDLSILEIQGTHLKMQEKVNILLCEVDATLPLLEYLNLEGVLLKTSDKRYAIIENEINEETFTFELIQKVNSNSRPLAFIQKIPTSEILPYNKYVEQMKNNLPVFKGFDALILLRIADCNLNTVYWEMFDGLQNLNYLILEKNNLMFIPDFAFYGTPNLKTLSLAWNKLLNIQIANLAGLLELQYLDLSYNNFSQLSELSLPPFPKLKLANFGNNPITIVFPNTFEVMNTTDSLIIGGKDTELSLITNSFLGLKLLKKLTMRNLKIPMLKKEVLVGMPNLNELIITGNIPQIEFDAFVEVFNLEKLFLSKCNLTTLSVDSFMGLYKVKIIDLSKNILSFLPPGIFDELPSLREIYLNDNKFQKLSKGMFANNHIRLIRLNGNPWHCSCEMSDWKPILINRIKQKTIQPCDQRHDKGLGCSKEDGFSYKYIYDNKVVPKCTTPKKYLNWNAFHVLRKQIKCVDFKPNIKRKNPNAMPQYNNKVNQSKEIVTTEKNIVHVDIKPKETESNKIVNVISSNKTENPNKSFEATTEILNKMSGSSEQYTSTESHELVSSTNEAQHNDETYLHRSTEHNSDFYSSHDDSSTENYFDQSIISGIGKVSTQSKIENTIMTAKMQKLKKLNEKFNTKLIKYLNRNETDNLNLKKDSTDSNVEGNDLNAILTDNSYNTYDNNSYLNLNKVVIKPRKPIQRKYRKRVYKPKIKKNKLRN